MKRKITYITGSRADFGLMTSVLREIEECDTLALQLYATGMHLMPKFGNTINEVKKIYPQTKYISAIYPNDNRESMALFTAKFLEKLVDVLKKERPDLVLTLGDRPEMLATAVACLYLGIPVGHIHGGERTLTVDEVARHAISKLAHLHFVATNDSAQRLRKLGEEKWRIFVTGAPAIDVIRMAKLPSRKGILNFLNFPDDARFILVTQHPVSEDIDHAAKQMEITLKAVKSFNLPAVVIYPNADAGGRKMIKVIDKEKTNPSMRIYPSLPYTSYLALEKESSVWVGNSSAMLIESASFHTPVVNIGSRQHNRQRARNVIDVGYNQEEIKAAIRKSLFDSAYRKKLDSISNPWGDGKTGKKIARILETIDLGPILLSKQLAY